MTSFEGLVEIGQDAAGVIEIEASSQAKGFFTTGVESCLVTLWVCEKATILLHDSAQVKLSDIIALLKNYGPVKRLDVFYRRSRNNDDLTHLKKHRSRLLEIMGVARVNHQCREDHEVPYAAFAVHCDMAGSFEAIPAIFVPRDALRIPEQKKRQAVCEVNNFFLEPDSQSLRLDIQYREGSYAQVRALDKTLEQLLSVLIEKNQARFFFQNIAVLNEAHNQGLLALPDKLLELAKTYNLDRLRTTLPTPGDLSAQAAELARYFR